MTRALRISLLLAFGSALCISGCGGKSHSSEHGEQHRTPALPPPTPDTTPIVALRTPAGLVLKIEDSSATAPTPSAPSAVPLEPTKAAP